MQSKKETDVRRRMKRKLDDLQFDFHGFSMEAFVSHIEKQYRRKIIFIEWDMPSGLFGVWISDGEDPCEYIFYDRNSPPLHKVHIQLHELSHFLCGHPTLKFSRDRISNDRTLDPLGEFIRFRSQSRQNATEIETEAEMMAALIKERVIRFEQLDQLSVGAKTDMNIVNYLKAMGLT